jgi:hypothetical protein
MVGARTTAANPPEGSDKKFVPIVLGMEVPVITSTDDRDQYVGRLVAVRGSIHNAKLTSIVGVWVDAPDDLRHSEAEAYAVGILRKFTVTEAEFRKLQEDARKDGNLVGIAHPGPGVYYQLFADLKWKLAEARPIPKKVGK